MKKKLLGTILAVVLSAATAVTAFAASKVGEVALPGNMEGQYALQEVSAETCPELAEKAPEVLELVLAVNAGTGDLTQVAEAVPELATELEGKSALSTFVDLTALDAPTMTADGKYEVTMSVPALSSAVSNVKVLHYSTVRALWEVINPEKTDMENKQITVVFEDLSPVMIIADVDEAKAADTATGTSPKTGVANYSVWFITAAIVLGGAAVVCFRKKKTAA